MKDLIWKVSPTGKDGSSIVLPEQVEMIEKENYTEGSDKFFEDELSAYKNALDIQNNVVNDLTGTFNTVDDLNKQSMLLGTLLSVSLMNMSKVKGNKALSNLEVWISFFNKVIGVALGNVDTKDMETFQDIVSVDDVKSYLVQWFITYISRFCKSMPDDKTQKFVAESIVSTVDSCFEAIVKSDINNELKKNN